ncbi:hypothetical protein c7_L626 [Megavirus courdo7]|uniref:Uncharacterized protein n=1 Tax=Megavirus courdo7 TaxID=1128135 RepID=H2EBB6_9VIRU|nr:hypothetical protein c7_L626 [Megavirus courdo7]
MPLINALSSRNYDFDIIDRKGFNFLALLFDLSNTKKIIYHIIQRYKHVF